MTRNAEQREYHAAKERSYRAKRIKERDLAIVQIATAAETLRANGYTLGQIVDLLSKENNNEQRKTQGRI